MPAITIPILMLGHLYVIFSLLLAALISTTISSTQSSNFLKIWARVTALPTLTTEKPQLSTTLVMTSTLDRATPHGMLKSRITQHRQKAMCTTFPSVNEMPMGGMQCSVM
jgi:hypothetical protein